MPRMIIDRMDDTPIDVPPGLTNVVVTETALGEVRGREGFYHYREYSAVDLARAASLEEVWHLLLLGRLPNAADLAAFAERTAAAREIPAPVAALLPPVVASGADPMAVLRTLLSGYGAAAGLAPLYDQTADERLDAALRVGAVTPGLIAAGHRLRLRLDPVSTRPELGFAADYLHRLTGTEPTPAQVAGLSAYLIAAIDHGFNASTFTARVIASTGADLAACVTGAVGALSGPLHGGAPGRVLAALDEIGTPDRIEPWVRDKINSGGRIMGFGHPVYRTEDPRSAMLKELVRGYGTPRAEFALEVERTVIDLLAELKPGRALNTNIEFYAAVVMEHCGIPAELFTPTFAVARVIGWTAHVLEQAQDSKIIRPSSRYVGATPPAPVPPLSER